MSDLQEIRAELEHCHRLLMEGHPDQRGLRQAVDDLLLAETEFILRGT